jgi:hypothetical protein
MVLRKNVVGLLHSDPQKTSQMVASRIGNPPPFTTVCGGTGVTLRGVPVNTELTSNQLLLAAEFRRPRLTGKCPDSYIETRFFDNPSRVEGRCVR